MNIQVGNCDRPSPSRDLLQTISVHTEDTSLDLYRDCYHWFRYAGIQSPVCCPSLKMVEPIWPTFFLARFIIFEIVLNPHIKADKSVIFFVIIFNRLADKSRTKNSNVKAMIFHNYLLFFRQSLYFSISLGSKFEY